MGDVRLTKFNTFLRGYYYSVNAKYIFVMAICDINSYAISKYSNEK